MNGPNPTAHATTSPPPAPRLALRSQFRLQWEPAQQAYVLLYPEGMVKLNQSAAEILKRCDGSRDLDALIADLEQAFATTGIAAQVHAFIADALAHGWLE